MPKPTADQLAEQSIQRTFYQYFMFCRSPGVIGFSVPNEHIIENKRDARFVANLKRMGMVPGAADFVVLFTGGAVLLEFKARLGTQSPDQREFELSCQIAGIPYFVCRSWEAGLEALESCNVPLARTWRDGHLSRT